MKNIVFVIGLFMVSIFFSGPSYADNAPNRGLLCRVDTRPPSEIFNAGFSSLGSDDSPRNHSRGVSCRQGDANTAIISTSADATYAGNFARRLLSESHDTVYVYIIISQSNFYNMARTLENMGYHTGVPDARRQSEWIAYDTIPANIIYVVRAYTSTATPPVQRNSNFNESIRAVINTQSYAPENEHLIPGREQLYVQANPSVGLCESASSWCKHTNNGRRTGDTYCTFVEDPGAVTTLNETSFTIIKGEPQ